MEALARILHIKNIVFMGAIGILFLTDSASGAQKKTPMEKFMKAQQLAKQKKWKKAISLLEPISDELSEGAVLSLSDYYREIKDFHAEIRHLNNLIGKKPKRVIYHFRRGRAYSRLHSNRKVEQKKFDEEAVASLRKSIELQTTFKSAYMALLEVFNRTNNTFEARTLLIDMISRFGDNPMYFTELCRLYITDGYIDDGIRICRQATTRAYKEPMNHVFLARGYIDKGNDREAQNVLTRASKKFSNSAQIQEVNGEYHLNKGSFLTAAKYFNRALAKDPKLPDSHIGLAISHFESKKYEKALTSYVNACKLSRSKTKDYRSAITKLRGINNFKMAEKYEGQIYKCTVRNE